MIRKNKVDVYIHRLFCDKCNTQMVYDNEKTGNESFTKHKHICPKCGYIEFADNVYPKQFTGNTKEIFDIKNKYTKDDLTNMIRILKDRGYKIYKEVESA